MNALSLAIRHLLGGRQTFLEYVKLAVLNDDPSAKAFWAAFTLLPERHRRTVSFDDVCVAAGVRPDVLLPAIVGHGMRMQADTSQLVQAAMQPKVIQAWGQSASRITGEYADISLRDRTMYLQAAGLVPVPKGAQIHLHANATANSQASAAAAAHPSVPSFLDDVDFDKTGPPAGFLEGQTTPEE